MDPWQFNSEPRRGVIDLTQTMSSLRDLFNMFIKPIILSSVSTSSTHRLRDLFICFSWLQF